MRHHRAGKKLGRDASHRKALYSNLAGALIEHGRIKTTVAKAKAVRPIAEQMITLGRRGDLHARRQAMAYLRSQEVVHKLFAEVGPALQGPAGRLLADRPDRPAPGRRGRDGLPRARRLLRRGAGRGEGGAPPAPAAPPPGGRGARRGRGGRRQARPPHPASRSSRLTPKGSVRAGTARLALADRRLLDHDPLGRQLRGRVAELADLLDRAEAARYLAEHRVVGREARRRRR